MDATTRYRLATGRMAEMQAEAMANRLAAQAARAQEQPHTDGRPVDAGPILTP